MHAQHQRRLVAAGVATAAALVLAGCASGDPLAEEDGGESASSDAIVIGSQDYYSNEIIAEIYAQALENAGFEVERNFSIGQREAYMPSIESGEIDLFPEYTGNTLQYFDDTASVTEADEVYEALVAALPESITALDYSEASDQDSYNVTAEYAEANDLTTIADLANVDGEIRVGGPAELEEREYGPRGLEELYGLTVAFEPTAATTAEALAAGQIDVGNVYSADPNIAALGLVTLEDPEGLFLASNVVPLASSDIAGEIAEVIDAVSAAMTAEDLVALNQESVDGGSTDDIAAEWLSTAGLV